MIAAGQAHGAIAQGVGQALFERAVYDVGSGQLLAGSFMDYAMPRADDVVSLNLGFNATRCTTNPLGVKGCGEAGAIAAFPAIANAIEDALAPLGVTDLAGPGTPQRIWQSICYPSGKNEPFRSRPISANELEEVASGSDT